MEHANDQNGAHEKADADPQEEPADDKTRLLREFTSRLNYLCVEHWFFSAIFILALGFIGYSIQARFATVTPGTWGVYGLLIVAGYVVLAALHLLLRRPDRAAAATQFRVAGPDKAPINDPHNIAYWRMTVTNHGKVAAGNVKMRLRDIQPRPKSGEWRGDYPYPVKRCSGTGESECRISPGDRESFEVLSVWRNAVQNDLYAGGLDTNSDREKSVRIWEDERWEMHYEVTSDDAPRVAFSVIMQVVDGVLDLSRKPAQSDTAAPTSQPSPSPATKPSTSAAAVDPVVTEYVRLLDWLEAGSRKAGNSIRFIVVRCPDLILHAPMKPGAYVDKITAIQESVRQKGIHPDWPKIRAKIHSDPELVQVLKDLGEIQSMTPEVNRQIIVLGQSLSELVVSSGWGGENAIDPFVELESAIISEKLGEVFWDAIAKARKQARRFQHSVTAPSPPPLPPQTPP